MQNKLEIWLVTKWWTFTFIFCGWTSEFCTGTSIFWYSVGGQVSFVLVPVYFDILWADKCVLYWYQNFFIFCQWTSQFCTGTSIFWYSVGGQVSFVLVPVFFYILSVDKSVLYWYQYIFNMFLNVLWIDPNNIYISAIIIRLLIFLYWRILVMITFCFTLYKLYLIVNNTSYHT